MGVLRFLKNALVVTAAALTLSCNLGVTNDIIDPALSPKVKLLTPKSGAVGRLIIAEGFNLIPFDSVKLGKVRVSVKSSTITSLSFNVPANAVSGKLYVYKGLMIDSTQTFRVTPSNEDLDVYDDQKILISEITATWSLDCGTWGKDLIKNAVKRYEERSVNVAFNASPDNDNLYVPDAAIYSNYIGATKYPTQAINLERVIEDTITKFRFRSITQDVYDKADPYVLKEAEAVVGLSFTQTNPGSYIIKTRTRFRKDLPTGKYNVAVFIVQDDVIDIQNGARHPYYHNNVFRKTATNDAGIASVWGVEIATNNAKIEAIFEKNFTVQAPSGNIRTPWIKQDMKAIAVIYKMKANGSEPEKVINCNIVNAK